MGLYFEYFPETQPIEFVKPAPRAATDDLIDDGFDPAELGVTSDGDSLVVDEAAERDFQAKAEEIFRKRYEKGLKEVTTELTETLSRKFLGEKIPVDVVNGATGEVMVPANKKITKALLVALARAVAKKAAKGNAAK